MTHFPAPEWDFGARRQATGTPAPPGMPGSPARGFADRTPRHAPVKWLVAAAVSVTAAVVLELLPGSRLRWSVLAWVLGGFVTIGLLTGFGLANARAQASDWYFRRRWPTVVAILLIVAATTTVAASAWRLADYAGRTWQL